MRIRYWVSVVLAVRVLLLRVIVKVSEVGLVEEPYTVARLSLTISTNEVEVAVEVAMVTVIDWMTSVPEDVFRVNVSEVVAVPPGATDTEGVSVPTPRVTTEVPGEIGLDGRSTPVL